MVNKIKRGIRVLNARIGGEKEQSRLPELLSRWLLPLVVVGSLLPSVCPATSVEQISTDQLIAGSELVIDARVTAVQVRPAGPRALPYTYATLEVIDVIKGNYAKRAIELGFMGGTLQGQTFTITDMHPPQIGERGIYFIESLSRQQVHPLYGWDQGHYVVRADVPTGEYRVYTRALQPVTGMESAELEAQGLSKGYAADLEVQSATKGAVALPVEQFKAGLRRQIEVQQ